MPVALCNAAIPPPAGRAPPLLPVLAGMSMLRDLSMAHPGRTTGKEADLAVLRRLTALTRLQLGICDMDRAYQPPLLPPVELCRVAASLHALRELDMCHVSLSREMLVELAASPITHLRAGGLDTPADAYAPLALQPAQQQQQQQGAAAMAAAAAAASGSLRLPPQLRELELRCAPCATALSALLPAPPSLDHIRLNTGGSPKILLPCCGSPGLMGFYPQPVRVHGSTPCHVARAVALLAGCRAPRAGDAGDELQLAAGAADASRPELTGPHAAWLRHLAPMDGSVVSLHLLDLQLSPGDLATLANAMPSLQVLALAQPGYRAQQGARLQQLVRPGTDGGAAGPQEATHTHSCATPTGPCTQQEEETTSCSAAVEPCGSAQCHAQPPARAHSAPWSSSPSLPQPAACCCCRAAFPTRSAQRLNICPLGPTP